MRRRLGRAATDSWTMTRRGIAHWARQPAQLVVGLVFPVMVLLMFAYFLGGGMSVSGGGDYKEYLVPGMLTLAMAFGLESTMIAVTQDLDKGVIDRFRSMPIAPLGGAGRPQRPGHAPVGAGSADPHRDRVRDGLALARRRRGSGGRGRAAAPAALRHAVARHPPRRGGRAPGSGRRFLVRGWAAVPGPRTTPNCSPSAGCWRCSWSSSRWPWAVTRASAAETSPTRPNAA
ncbi:ABC-2 type transport system permease protein [Streptomyces bingchenggensis BCW-1]|uniref:ABC-2 type transport system permease protein n=1 Tax=Streptomyces bingchenggensis (strain BCW-1) TaxID=749414 RepID=D7CGC5_STRBB|nr:ABC-2 type transport system permease protein [Streptomyces bingchenggensis BCW-1]